MKPVDLTPELTAGTPSTINYAQWLVEREKKRNLKLIDLEIMAVPPKGKDMLVLGSTAGHGGQKAEADDLEVAKSGQTKETVSAAGDQLEVLLPYRDANLRPIGVLSAVFPYTKGEDKAVFVKQADELARYFARRTPNTQHLVEPAFFDMNTPADTYAQALVEEALKLNPDVIFIVLHVTPPGQKNNVIVGTDIGRFGKLADEDDTAVWKTGQSKVDLNEAKDRLEVEARLVDATGSNLGAISIIFPYKPGDEKEARHKTADNIVKWFAEHIPSVGKLFEKAS